MDSLDINTIFIKFFDISWNNELKKALPVAKIFFRDTAYLKSKKIVPTVFITNEVFYKLDSTSVEQLAANTGSLIKKYLTGLQLTAVPEVQMDCDWTAKTKSKYFYFLSLIKAQQIAPATSATIRLHQLKYTKSSGVPPVDRGLLMCYNMGNLQNVDAENSIINSAEFKKYKSYIKNYSLPLDVGLPLFEWYVLFRNRNYNGLFQSIPDSILTGFEKVGNHRFRVLKNTVVYNRQLQAGDILRYENSNPGDVKKVADLLNENLSGENIRVILYHCDSVILTKYKTHELEGFYSSLHGN